MQSSSVYPLFKPGASSLGGACLVAHVTIQPCSFSAEVTAVTLHCRIFGKLLLSDCAKRSQIQCIDVKSVSTSVLCAKRKSQR